jgi:hypothetical protein
VSAPTKFDSGYVVPTNVGSPFLKDVVEPHARRLKSARGKPTFATASRWAKGREDRRPEAKGMRP